MTLWRDQLRPASLRGVEIEVESRDLSGGRRLAEHQYPRRDGSSTEDLGRAARTIKVKAFLFGATYQNSRDALIAALEAEGPADYIDPWGMPHRVVCRGWQLSENLSSGGYCSVDIDMLEAPSQQGHRTEVDTAHAVTVAANAAANVAQQNFSAATLFSGANLLLSDAQATVNALVNAVENALPNALAAVGVDRDAVAAVATQAAALCDGVIRLAAAPQALGAKISNLLQSLAASYQTAKGCRDGLAALVRFADLVPMARASGGGLCRWRHCCAVDCACHAEFSAQRRAGSDLWCDHPCQPTTGC